MAQIKKHFGLYVMFLPTFLYFCVFSVYPLIRGFIMSLQEFRLIGDRPFAGFANYSSVIHDPQFWRALNNTLIIGSGILVIGFIAPIIAALALNEVMNLIFKRFVQTVVYLPHLFSWVVVGGIWIFILSPDGGLVNALLTSLGRQEIHFLTDNDYARSIMVLSAVWRDMGYNCIIYLAGIVAINPTLYEAARIDGTNRFQEIIYITLPQLVPTMKIVFLLNLMNVLRIFDQIYVMSNPSIAAKVDVLMTYVYEKGILNFDMGIASAASYLVIAMTLLLVFLTRKLTKYDLE